MDFDRAKEAQRQRRLAVMLFLLIGSMVFVVWFTAIDLLSETEPQDVATENPPSVAVTESNDNQPNCEDPLSRVPACVARREALVIWSDVDELVDSLMEKQVTVWAPERISRTVEQFAFWVQAFTEGRFIDASEGLRAVLADLQELETLSQQILDESITAGWRAFENESSEEAIESFELALMIDPNNQSAREGLSRSNILGDVLDLYYRGVATESNGNLEEARSLFEEAYALDPEHTQVQSALNSIRSRISHANYRTALSSGFAFLEREDGAGALQSFQKALAIRSNSNEALSGIERAQNMLSSQSLAVLLFEAASAAEQEDWERSSSLYGEALAIDPNAQVAIEGKEQIDELIHIESEINALIDQPHRLSSKAVFEYADSVLSQAQRISANWPRLQSKANDLAATMNDMQSPVTLLVRSDGRTNVSIQRLGDLGRFEQRVIDILPGKYVLQGTRRGYRDIRLEIEISPGSEPTAVTVVCNESF